MRHLVILELPTLASKEAVLAHVEVEALEATIPEGDKGHDHSMRTAAILQYFLTGIPE